MSETSGGDVLFGCVTKILLSPGVWVVGAFLVVFVLIPISINLDTPAVDTVAAETPTPVRVDGWDLTDTSINRDSACCGAVGLPLILALVFAFKR